MGEFGAKFASAAARRWPGSKRRRALRDMRALFDGDYYLDANPDLAEAGVDPFEHYLRQGWAEGRNPAPLFDTDYYLEQNPDVAQAGINPLLHFIESGAREGRRPHSLFDPAWYLNQYPDVAASGVNPLVHFSLYGARERRRPHPLFDTDWYLEQYPEVAAAEVNPLIDYMRRGWKEARNPNPYFDTAWYLTAYPDVAQAGKEPLAHFTEAGSAERRRTGPNFHTDWYAEQYPEAAASGANLLQHYLEKGKHDGLQPTALHSYQTPMQPPAAKDHETAGAKLRPEATHALRPEQAPPGAVDVGSLIEPGFDRNGRALHPRRRVGDGRRLVSFSLDRDHFWYESSALQTFRDNLNDKPLLPPGARRVLVIGHDYRLVTGVMRPMAHYLSALAAAGGYEITSLELAPNADALVARDDADVHDIVLINSLPFFFDHDNGVELMRRCGPGKAAIYLHETDFIFDKLEREKPERYRAFAEAAREFNFLCVSQRQKDMLARRFNAEQAHVVYNTSPVEIGSPKAPEADFDPERPLRIVMAGTIQPRKGVDLFSRVADMAAEAGLPWTFHWAGKAVGRDVVYQSRRVEFVGNLGSAKIVDFISDADVFLLSSVDDPFPLSGLEALQMMKRLVAYRKTGMSEIIEDVSGCAVYDEHTPQAAFEALKKAAAAPFDAERCQAVNERFALTNFVRRMNDAIGAFYEPSGPPLAPSGPKVAAVLHLYYHDLWHEIRSYLENLRHIDVDLYVTLTKDKPREELDRMRDEILRVWPAATIVECPNRGMDVGPFVEVARRINEQGRKYDLFVKVHSKKSLTASGAAEGAGWREELINGLLGSPTIVDRIMSIFASHREIGMVSLKNMLLEKSSNDIAEGRNVNAPNMNRLADRMKLSDKTQRFFRGSMFWARFEDICEPIARAGLSIDEFDEGHQVDGSKAHAMERLFACMIRSKGGTLHSFDPALPKSVKLLKNRHEAEDIYIIAAGASAGYINPDFFKDKCVIGVNRVFVRFPCTYVIQKEFPSGEYERELFSTNAIPIAAQWDSGNICQGKMRRNLMVCKRPEYYFYAHLENTREIVNLSVINRDSDKLVVSYSTITTAMHLAAYMGAKNIILVGHDCGLLNGKAVFDGYYRDMSVSPWKSMDDYKAWLGRIEAQTLTVRDRLTQVFGCNVVSINPFVNFGLEGNIYSKRYRTDHKD